MQTYDSLVDQDPYFQEIIEQKVEQRAEQRAKQIAEQIAELRALEKAREAEIRILQEMALEAVQEQYPSLEELAQEKITLIRQPDVLRQLVKQIYKAPDEGTVRWLLNTFVD